MIRGLVTVGTTSFDGLVTVLDQQSDAVSLTFQIADGLYEPRHHTCLRFSPDLFELIRTVDFVICHAGAGTVYTCLEIGVPLLVVPNLEREDHHQVELAEFISSEDFSAVLTLEALRGYSLEDISQTILEHQRKPYKKDPFFAVDEIIAFFNS